jgi:hypothetical protein
MARSQHVVVTGTGRSGTTFLVELLTHLGLDTGFNPDELEVKKDKIANAGLEVALGQKELPYIVKSPWFCDYAKEMLGRSDIKINHVFIPIRDVHQAAESRRDVHRKNLEKESFMRRLTKELKYLIRPSKRKQTSEFAGGLWHTQSLKKGDQESALLNQFYRLMLVLSEVEIPVTLMKYPEIVEQPAYLYERLKPVLESISYDRFHTVYQKTVRRDLVHTY